MRPRYGFVGYNRGKRGNGLRSALSRNVRGSRRDHFRKQRIVKSWPLDVNLCARVPSLILHRRSPSHIFPEQPTKMAVAVHV